MEKTILIGCGILLALLVGLKSCNPSKRERLMQQCLGDGTYEYKCEYYLKGIE